MEKERKKKEKEKEKEEKQNKKIEELKSLIKGRTEDKLIKEDIKIDDDIKDNEFYKTYIKNLEKKSNINLIQEKFKKDYNFMPMIYKHPEKIYLKSITDYRINKEKLKSYNKKTGLFNISLSRPRTNKYYVDAENRDNLDNNNDKEEQDIQLKVSDKNLNSINNKSLGQKVKYKKKNINLKISKGNSTAYNNKNINNPTMNSFYNKFISNNSNQKKNNSFKKICKLTKKDNNEEMDFDDILKYVIKKENEKIFSRQGEIYNQKSSRRNKEQKNAIINSLNEPFNPYSPLFYNSILNTNYNVGLQYKGMERGVPHLQMKKIIKSSLPPLNDRKNLFKERLICHTFSSFNNSKKVQKISIFPSSSYNRINKNNSRNKSYKIKNNKKDNENIIQSYREKNKFNEADNKDKIVEVNEIQE